MRKRNHLIIALVLFVVIVLKPTIANISTFINDVSKGKLDLSSITPSPENPELLLASVVLFGAFFPDIDYIKMLRQWHRKLLHNVFALIFATFASSIVGGLMIAEVFFIGCVSHIFEDVLTPTGVYLIWPIDRKFHIGWKVSTGTWEDDTAMIIIVALIIGIYILATYFTSPH
jgi:membrane-bound metal-dependent hydrolase YbcI (DUF457 family)